MNHADITPIYNLNTYFLSIFCNLLLHLDLKTHVPKMKATLIADRRDVQTLHVSQSRPFHSELAAGDETIQIIVKPGKCFVMKETKKVRIKWLNIRCNRVDAGRL